MKSETNFCPQIGRVPLRGGINQRRSEMKYRKKPVVIEASQWFRIGDHAAVLDYHEAYDKGYRHPTPKESGIANVNNCYTGKGLIQTLEGWHEVTPGDYIIEGVKGEFYPCKPDIFAMTYEVAE